MKPFSFNSIATDPAGSGAIRQTFQAATAPGRLSIHDRLPWRQPSHPVSVLGCDPRGKIIGWVSSTQPSAGPAQLPHTLWQPGQGLPAHLEHGVKSKRAIPG